MVAADPLQGPRAIAGERGAAREVEREDVPRHLGGDQRLERAVALVVVRQLAHRDQLGEHALEGRAAELELVEVAGEDIAAFTARCPMNARPLLPANRRFILASS